MGYCSVTQSCSTLCEPISWNLLKFMSIESVMPSNHLVLCCPLLLLPSIFSASGSFLMSQLFASGGQSIGVSASTSVLPMNIQDWSPLGLTGFILESWDCQESSPTPPSKASILWHSAFFMVQLTSIHDYWKNHSFDNKDLCCKVMFLLFNMLSRFFIAFLPRRKCLLISWLQSPSQLFWSPRKWSLSLFPLLPHLFAMKWWDQMLWP